MKKYLIITLISTAFFSTANAQDFKVKKSDGKLVLNLSSATIEGYSGSEVVFSSQRPTVEKDPREEGLRAINGSGYVDNTGLGISVTEQGTTTEVVQVSGSAAVKILVPKGILVSLVCHKLTSSGGKVHFKDMSNEIEVSTDYNSIDLENITGPLTVRSVYGSVNARFSGNITGPVSIVSVYSSVDVTIPVTTKANLKLESNNGTILASADLQIVLDKKPMDDMVSYGAGGKVTGTLGGGGPEFKLSSQFGKIYLRKAK